MTAERWRRIEDLFDLLADLPPDRQRELLEKECAGDPDLFASMTQLLLHDRAGNVRVAEAIEGLAHIPATEEIGFVGRKMGPYRVLREVGRGGMGVVFEAVRDDEEYHKRVALKVAARAAYSPEFLQRFRNERQILAQLEHPHIARFLDGGTTPENIPFFAMEYVEGLPLDEYVEKRKLSIPARLQLFLQVCEAVEYAHQSLVIHRDLKPGNILVADGLVRLLDFGIAKLLESGDGVETRMGFSPATPDYCSPEQVRGQRVTTRSDVYALGLILYKILSGEQGQQADTSSPSALERSICDREARAPSTSAAARGARALARQLRGDLDTIVLAATHKDPARRYSSVAALSEDLRRYLAGSPIAAREDHGWYRGKMFARRHWMPLTGVLLLIGSLVAGVVGTSYQARLAERRFQQVRGLANALLGDVYKSIRGVPASTKAQEVVLRTAVQYLDGLAKEAGSDRALQLEIANGYAQIARISYSLNAPSLGRAVEARGYHEKAKGMLESLHARSPGDLSIAASYAGHLQVMAQFLDSTGLQTASHQHVERAIRIAEDALRKQPANTELLGVLSQAYDTMLGRFIAAANTRQYAPRYLEVAEQRAKLRPRSGSAISLLAGAYQKAGRLAHVEGDEAEAERLYRRSLELYRQQVELAPTSPVARRNLAIAWGALADWALGPMGTIHAGAVSPPVAIAPERRREALHAYDQALEQNEWNYQRDPHNITVKSDYAVMLGRKGGALPPGDPKAVELLERSLALLDAEKQSDSFLLRFVLDDRASLAERRRQMGQFAQAVAEWEAAERTATKWLQAHPDDPFVRRYMIPAYQNWAMELMKRRDVAGALRVARRAETLAVELEKLSALYVRGPRWLARVKGWMAEMEEQAGHRMAAEKARAESMELWQRLAARADQPPDVMAEARKMIGTSSR